MWYCMFTHTHTRTCAAAGEKNGSEWLPSLASISRTSERRKPYALILPPVDGTVALATPTHKSSRARVVHAMFGCFVFSDCN